MLAGLGKTITGLALILKTLHARPAPPPLATVESLLQHEPRRHVFWYTRPSQSAAPQSGPPSASSRRSSRRISGSLDSAQADSVQHKRTAATDASQQGSAKRSRMLKELEINIGPPTVMQLPAAQQPEALADAAKTSCEALQGNDADLKPADWVRLSCWRKISFMSIGLAWASHGHESLGNFVVANGSGRQA